MFLQKLSRLLTDFVDKFRRAAQMLSISGRPRLKPIVELAGTVIMMYFFCYFVYSTKNQNIYLTKLDKK